MKKQCFLILAHKELNGLVNVFLKNKDANFYIHIDLKSNFFEISKRSLKILIIFFFIDKRIDINGLVLAWFRQQLT